MSQTAHLQATIVSNQQEAAVARRRVVALQSQSSQIQGEIDELKRQLSELSSFEFGVQQDCADTDLQLAQRRSYLIRIKEVKNVAMARQLSERMAVNQLFSATNIMQDGRRKIFENIAKTKTKLINRIGDLQGQQHNLLSQIAQQQAVVKSCERIAYNAGASLRQLQQDNS